MATKYGQLANALLGAQSLWSPTGYASLTPFHADDTVYTGSSDGKTPVFGGQVRYPLSKNSTLIGLPTWECAVSAGVLGAGRRAAFVKNFGDQIVQEVTFRFGGNILQSIPHAVFAPMWRRLCYHDNHIEGVNAQVLGGLPAGNAATEGVREAAVTSGLTIYCPLDELFWTSNRDEFWMPEAYSMEAEIILQLAPLARLVYSDNGGNPFTTAPALSSDVLRYREITLSAAEKENRLKSYMTQQGLVNHFLDIERQESFTYTGAGGGTRTLVVPLDNFRMDIAELIFVNRIDSNAAAGVTPGVSEDWRGDAMESTTAPSIITAASVACVQPILSYSLYANGKCIYQDTAEFWNRAHIRQQYHPDSQISDAFYSISFAEFPEDRKNATGHQSAQVLGKLELRITLTDPAAGIIGRIDCYAHSHNFMQSRAGGISKALH